MKYTREERLEIGRRIYNGEITRYTAAVQYGIGCDTARGYMRLYRDTYRLKPKDQRDKAHTTAKSGAR